MVPGRAVADAGVEDVQLGVVGHGVPDRAAAAGGLPALPKPGRRAFFLHHLVGGRVVRLTRGIWGGVEPPDQLAAGRVIGRQVAAHAVLAAAVADQHLVLDDPRRAGDRVGLGGVGGLDAPGLRARFGVERNQAAIERPHIDPALPDSDPAVDHVATGVKALVALDLRVEGPLERARLGVEGVDLGPGRGGVEHPVDHDRRGLLAAIGVKLVHPGQAQRADIGGVDLVQGAEALLVIGPAVGKPLTVAVGRGDPCAIDVAGLGPGLAAGGEQGGGGERPNELQHFHCRLPGRPFSRGLWWELCAELRCGQDCREVRGGLREARSPRHSRDHETAGDGRRGTRIPSAYHSRGRRSARQAVGGLPRHRPRSEAAHDPSPAPG